MHVQKGFTLIELIMALVVLAFISLGIGAFLQLGAQGYTDTVDRERLQSEARFVVERLTRELRHAAPNSVQVSSGCLSFYPVSLAATYWQVPDVSDQINVLVQPDAQTVAKWNQGVDGQRVAVGYTSATEYQNGTARVMEINKSPTQAEPIATLTVLPRLTDRSPGRRLYLYSSSVSFCQQGNLLLRRVENGPAVTLTNKLNHFEAAAAGGGLNDNGLIHFEMTLTDPVSQESSDYSQSVQVINVL
ncbi:type II secretion system protein [Photobacterium sp. GJ3]|uniref:PilW family protein n=1 Tax=Photobacterium sp. GJ3 TaxID=2829502 RepID=UPI001B8C37CC|nr:type II secretion system protein [Photobacterium sp. GJ3]QUJ67140.1 type II secretion system protein [Photobacterium sp. GJ3]